MQSQSRCEAVHDEASTGEHYVPALAERALRERIRDLEERIDLLERTLVRERDARASATRELERFCQQLSGLAHELRNPLSSISGWLQLICNGRLELETKRRAFASMTRSLRTLTRTVEDFGDYARCIDGSITLQQMLVSPGLQLAHALRECRPLADQREISLDVQLAPSLPELRADPSRLRQIFELLVNGVLRATPRGGELQIRIGRERQHVCIRIGESERTRVDHPELGPLAPEDGDERRFNGLTLSLQLARRLVELHAGSFAGIGHAFEVLLPMPGALA
jgi:signal transduction histidine kinase